ncbi:phytoene synthase [Chryseobacterium sp. Leaf404]|uniref:phytoene/squalene synthase family protein n=1 Tax=unclassified Chryseobacterium TaxID=2593645 RepID=UPI0006F23E8A|nr:MULTISPECIES: phytoene/squalene synthase family protein [unclassified Chryseobacterium]KQT17930.1 phytoene synthase [Chryseobacterium sp. Leaf404]
MKQKFDDLSFKISKQTTQQYSTSFSLGILALSPKIRNAIYAIYGYVRLADEIVDSFDGYDKRILLERFKKQTEEALSERISLNPMMQSFQETVVKYNIDQQLIHQFLRSMEMDLDKIDYNSELYNEYILGSAEVVGLMCLHVFVDGDSAAFEKLKPFAMKLGSAFQKVNFLRDMNDDFEILGRTYFPGVNILNFDVEEKRQIEEDIQNEFKLALEGIRMLPKSSKFGVYLAYRYYISLFNKIRRTPATAILKKRIRISNGRKISVMMTSYLQYKIAVI